MDTFRETTPEEAKLIALQFMGQNMGELKELDKRIINKTNQLQGNSLKVKEILNSIPSTQAQIHQRNSPQPQPAIQQPRSQVVVQNSDNNILIKISSQLETIIKLLDK